MTVNNDVHTLTGAYVLDALSEMERRAFENHMSGCPACYQEVAELRETTARLGAATAAYPPPDLWNRVLTATKQSRQLTPLSGDNFVARPKPWAARVAVFAAAASVLVAAGLGVGWYATNNDLQDELAQSQVELGKVQDLLGAPDLKISRGTIDGGGTATAMVSQAQNEMVMMVQDAPALPSDRVYQAWYVKPDGSATSAGLLAGSSGSIAADDLAPAAGADALGITVERAGGALTPTLDDLVAKISLA